MTRFSSGSGTVACVESGTVACVESCAGSVSAWVSTISLSESLRVTLGVSPVRRTGTRRRPCGVAAALSWLAHRLTAACIFPVL